MDDCQQGPYRNRLSPRLVVGASIMVLGGLLTLDNMGLFELGDVWRFWPVILILLGITKYVHRSDAFGALVWVAVGLALLAANFGIVRVRQLWPLVLVVVGGRLVFGAFVRGADPGVLRVSRGPEVDDVDRLDAFAVLGGVVRGTNSTNFKSGAATAFMGGCEIDLRRAKIQGEAVFDAFAMWGGVEIKVPEDWAVENRGMGLLGGFVDSTHRPAEAKGRLVLTGLAVMGGVEAKN